jgi:TPP-dependent indolepyruvate ferredoxin oxidoreductase alpha subunit
MNRKNGTDMAGAATGAERETLLLMGNEAIARGALEAGVGVAAGYPGNPSSEIVAAIAQAAGKMNVYAEWSVNEKVALEVAAAASLTGVRALCAMKQNGLNVALDFLANLNLTGVESGLVVAVCDDPGGISSTNEQDSRHAAKVHRAARPGPEISQDIVSRSGRRVADRHRRVACSTHRIRERVLAVGDGRILIIPPSTA